MGRKAGGGGIEGGEGDERQLICSDCTGSDSAAQSILRSPFLPSVRHPPPFLAATGGVASGLLLRDPLMAGDTEGADVLQRALAATLDDRHDVIGIPVTTATKEPAKFLPERGAFATLLGCPGELDPLPLGR